MLQYYDSTKVYRKEVMIEMKRTVLLLMLIVCFYSSGCSLNHTKNVETTNPIATETTGKNTEEDYPSTQPPVSTEKDQLMETDRNPEMSVVDVINSCGISIEWIEDGVAFFEINGEKYIIDCQKESIHKEGQVFNYIFPPPGTENGFVFSTANDIYVDYETMKSILYVLGINIDLRRGTD